MKPLIPKYVLRGIHSLKTDEMVTAIEKCFRTDGLLAIARLDSTYARAKEVLVSDIFEMEIPQGEEVEEDVGRLEDDPTNSGDDSNNLSNENEPGFDIEVQAHRVTIAGDELDVLNDDELNVLNEIVPENDHQLSTFFSSTPSSSSSSSSSSFSSSSSSSSIFFSSTPTSSSSSSSSSSSLAPSSSLVLTSNKRNRQPNSRIGEVKKGKYSVV